MKILYILNSTVLSGGATKAFLNMISATMGENDSAIVICPDKEGVYKYLEQGHIPNVKPLALHYAYDTLPFLNSILDYAMYYPRRLKRMLLNYKGSRDLMKVCREFQPDIIHTNTSVNNIGHIAAKKLAIPHIYHIREYGDKDFNLIVPNQDKKFAAPHNYKIAITKDILRYKKLQSDHKAKVIYDGVIRSVDIPAATDHRYFLYAGRLTEKKGIFDLLEAYGAYASKEKNEAMPLKLAGSVKPDVESWIKNTIVKFGIDGKVELLGECDDLRNLYAGAAAVIVPSFFEGFGFVLPEAMAAGALTVGRDTGGTKEQYDNGKELSGEEIGIRFSTIPQLTDILTSISHSTKSDYSPLISRASDTVNQLYTTSVHGKSIRDFYNHILRTAP